MNPSQTVSVEPLESCPALLMVWQTHADSQDVRLAFQKLLSLLENSPKPLYLFVDLRQNVNMPLSETISNALLGAYTHPNLLACLVFGGHSRAKIVASIIQRISHEHKILWFSSETEAYAFLQGKLTCNGA